MILHLFSWVLLFFYLLPIVVSGVFILRKSSSITRFELLLPVGIIVGISIFTFIINLFSFIVVGRPAIIMAYLLTVCIGILYYQLKLPTEKISYPVKKSLIFFFLSLIFWGIFIFWKGNNALIGSDTNLYYSIAHTFLKGNFPPLTPWQPDIPLTYHLGSFQLLAAFYLFTNLSFEFLHIFFSCLFIFISSQIIIWIFTRHQSVSSFLIGNICAAIILISFGFFKFIIPHFPIHLPQIKSLTEFFFYIRNLPTVNQSIEVYGAVINLDALIYFIFHSYGLVLALSLIVLLFYQTTKKFYLNLIVSAICISSLALIDESIFIFIAPSLVIGYILLGNENKTVRKNIRDMILVFVLATTIILFQGGVITNSLFLKTDLEKSILINPSKTQVKDDFSKYHYFQETSKIFELKNEWLPFQWFNIGADLMIIIPIIFLIFIKSAKDRVFVLTFYFSGIFSLLAYNYIVPKFLVANGNRMLGFTFLFLSLASFFSVQVYLSQLTRKVIKIILISYIFIFILIPTVLPSLTLLSKNRFSDNKLTAISEQKTEGIDWIERNIPYDNRVMVLDIRTPHPSGQARVMIQAGVFAPVFPGNYRAYTIEASPEYFDIAYYLNPSAMKRLGINVLLIDSSFYKSLSEKRKQDLENKDFFQEVFSNSGMKDDWEKIFMIKDEYLNKGDDIAGSFSQYEGIFPKEGKIYIDNEENFNPSYLRRALIFSIREKNLYYLPQSGEYLNVEAEINKSYPLKTGEYDYLVLGKGTDPKKICNCQTRLIWEGFKNEVYVWQKI